MEELEEITIVNEDGEEFDFAVDRLFELNGKRYAVLIPLEDLEEDDEDEELEAADGEEEEADADDEDDEVGEGCAVIFRVDKDEKDEEVLVDIDDDAEFDAVEKHYVHLLEEEE